MPVLSLEAGFFLTVRQKSMNFTQLDDEKTLPDPRCSQIILLLTELEIIIGSFAEDFLSLKYSNPLKAISMSIWNLSILFRSCKVSD